MQVEPPPPPSFPPTRTHTRAHCCSPSPPFPPPSPWEKSAQQEKLGKKAEFEDMLGKAERFLKKHGK